MPVSETSARVALGVVCFVQYSFTKRTFILRLPSVTCISSAYGKHNSWIVLFLYGFIFRCTHGICHIFFEILFPGHKEREHTHTLNTRNESRDAQKFQSASKTKRDFNEMHICMCTLMHIQAHAPVMCVNCVQTRANSYIFLEYNQFRSLHCKIYALLVSLV